ncbi:MAG: DUF4192 domain-containing protein [Jatrophihabitantaceae bacterium]
MSENETVPTLRISGPADLLQGVPYLLGFHPAESLVLIGLADGQLVVTVRVDLVDLVEPDVLADALEAMRRGGTDTVVAAVYDDSPRTSPLPWNGVARMVREECERCGCELADVLRVAGGRWWSYECSSWACCPPEGKELPGAPSPFVAAATYAGLVALPDRDSLSAQLDPLPDLARATLEPMIAEQERAVVAAVLDGAGGRTERSLKRTLFAAARAADRSRPAAALGDRDAARFAVALSGTGMRDSVWMAVDDRRLDGRELWRDLARRVPAPYDAAPLFLFGWACWRAGHGALAGIAAQRAIDSDPTYSAADLLLAALARGLDPRQLPRLRLSRSA